jgi:hypothetical protein
MNMGKEKIILIVTFIAALLILSNPLRTAEPVEKVAVWASGFLTGIVLLGFIVFLINIINNKGSGSDARGKSFKK